MATTRRKSVRGSGRAKNTGRTRRRMSRERALTLPELFQRYFDRQLRPPARSRRPPVEGELGGVGGPGPGIAPDPRGACCRRIADLLGGPGPFGHPLEGLANDFFGATPEQGAALRGWPEHQLWLFLQTLRLGLRCPGVPTGPDGFHDPRPTPDPVPFRMQFRGRVSRGAKSLEIRLSGANQIEITFVAPRIP